MSKICFIYKTTCLVTGLIYVGRHITEDLNDGYIGCGVYRQKDVLKPCSYFQNAVKKYGYQNFRREILELCERDQLDEREKFWINLLDSTDVHIGFNMTKGGNGFNRHHSEYSKRKMSKVRRGTRTGDKNTFFQKKHSKRSLEKMRNFQQGRHVGELNTNFGKVTSVETKIKMTVTAQNRTFKICPHCLKQSKSMSNLKRWHFDNCKQRVK